MIPFVVEAWATAEPRGDDGDDIEVAMYVNRTPDGRGGQGVAHRGSLVLDGCGLEHRWPKIQAGRYRIEINLTTPWCPVTTDGKEPDLSPFVGEIAAAVKKAARRAAVPCPSRRPPRGRHDHKDIILRHLDEGVDKASGGGLYRFNQRQLFYVLRPVRDHSHWQGAVMGQLLRGHHRL